MKEWRDPEAVLCFGDWHGVRWYAKAALERAAEDFPEVETYVHLGDFGFSSTSGFSKVVNEALTSLGKRMVVVPGNHEDYGQLRFYTVQDPQGFLRVKKDNLFLAPRGHRWEWSGVPCAALGGGFSIDRRHRTEGKSWWPEELITQEEADRLLKSEGNISVLFTHDAPQVPLGVGALPWKLTEEERALDNQNRAFVAQVLEEKGVQVNVHGHFHKHYFGRFMGAEVVGLDCDEGSFEKNRYLLDLLALRDGYQSAFGAVEA